MKCKIIIFYGLHFILGLIPAINKPQTSFDAY